MVEFDLTGKIVNKGTQRINMRDFAGVQFEGEHLSSADNPHEVPAWFAHELVSTGRATYAPDTQHVTVADPQAEHRDPVFARGKRR